MALAGKSAALVPTLAPTPDQRAQQTRPLATEAQVVLATAVAQVAPAAQVVMAAVLLIAERQATMAQQARRTPLAPQAQTTRPPHHAQRAVVYASSDQPSNSARRVITH